MPLAITAAGSNQGSFNGATPVEIVAAPASGRVRVITSLRVVNLDTAAVALTINKLAVTTDYAVFHDPALPAFASANNTVEVVSGRAILLTATSQSLTGVLGGAPATTNPNYVASWYEFAIT